MLIYLDANIVQYIVDNQEYVFGEISGYSGECPVTETKLKRELNALRKLIFLDQLGDWVYACTPHLWDELNAGKPTTEQQESYPILMQAWKESAWTEAFPLDETEVTRVEASLRMLRLKSADRRHLAEAVVLNASWFLTNDEEVIKKCKKKGLPLHIAKPSECLSEISVGLFLRQ
jgi:hypothetical protein